MPIDLVLVNPLIAAIQRYFPALMNWFMKRDMNQKFDHELYNLKPEHQPLRNSLTEFICTRLEIDVTRL